MLEQQLNDLRLSRNLMSRLKRTTWDLLFIEQEKRKKAQTDLSYAKWQLENNDDRCFITLINFCEKEAKEKFSIGAYSDSQVYFFDLINLEINRIERINKKEINIANQDLSREFRTLKNSVIFYLVSILLKKDFSSQAKITLEESIPKAELKIIYKALPHIEQLGKEDILLMVKTIAALRQGNFKPENINKDKLEKLTHDNDLRKILKFYLITLKQNLRRRAFKDQVETFNKEKRIAYKEIISINESLEVMLTSDIAEERNSISKDKLKKDLTFNRAENFRLSAFLCDDMVEAKMYFKKSKEIIQKENLGKREYFITCGREDEYLAFLEKDELKKINFFAGAEHAYSQARVGRSYLIAAIKTVLKIKYLSKENIKDASEAANLYFKKRSSYKLSKIFPELEEIIYLASLINRDLNQADLDNLLTKRDNELASMILSAFFAKKAVVFENDKSRDKYESFFNSALRAILNKESIDKYLFQTDENIRGLITAGENEKVEFKSTLRWDILNDKPEKELEKEIVKTIAGFSNAEGGTLLIGVNDEGEIIGLEKDYKNLKGTKDVFERHLRDLVKKAIGEFNVRIKVIFPKQNLLEICQVSVEKGINEIFIEERNKDGNNIKIFYVRRGNRTLSLELQEAINYCRERFY